MNTVGERILEIKNQFFGSGYGSNVKFAKAINVEPNVVSNWFLRGDGIGAAVMQQVLAFDKSIDANWLITGEGQMLKEASSSPPNSDAAFIYKELYEKKEAELAVSQKRIEELIEHNARLEQELQVFTSRKKTVQEWEIVAGAVDTEDGTEHQS